LAHGAAQADQAGQLEQWFRDGAPRLTGAKVLTLRGATGANGYSNETLYCTVEHEATGRQRVEEFAVRLPPLKRGLFENYDMGRQFLVMDRLNRYAGIPTPVCRWLEPDTSILGRQFFVMNFIQGRIPPDAPKPYNQAGWVYDAAPADRRTVWFSAVDCLISLSRVDWRAAQLDFLDWPDPSRSRIAQDLENCDAIRQWGEKGLPQIDIPDLRKIRRYLDLNRPEEREPGIVWGDARFGNIMYQGYTPVAMLDWELSSIGDPVNDLAYFLMMDLFFRADRGARVPTPQIDGFPSIGETLDYYEDATGRKMKDFNFYLALNAYRVLCWSPGFGRMLLQAGTMTTEEASHYRVLEKFTPAILDRISKS
jgi:aminoglycoside phosphotransferase (APT) family kinase protein